MYKCNHLIKQWKLKKICDVEICGENNSWVHFSNIDWNLVEQHGWIYFVMMYNPLTKKHHMLKIGETYLNLFKYNNKTDSYVRGGGQGDNGRLSQYRNGGTTNEFVRKLMIRYLNLGFKVIIRGYKAKTRIDYDDVVGDVPSGHNTKSMEGKFIEMYLDESGEELEGNKGNR